MTLVRNGVGTCTSSHHVFILCQLKPLQQIIHKFPFEKYSQHTKVVNDFVFQQTIPSFYLDTQRQTTFTCPFLMSIRAHTLIMLFKYATTIKTNHVAIKKLAPTLTVVRCHSKMCPPGNQSSSSAADNGDTLVQLLHLSTGRRNNTATQQV